MLDRGELLDGCTARLLRSTRQDNDLRGHLGICEELAPSPEEVEQRLPTYLAMAASGTAMVAKVALRELRALDAKTPLEPQAFADLCADVFARAETGVIGEQISWIDASLKRDPAAAGQLRRTLGAALTHPSVAVQRRALKLIAKHAKNADRDVLAELRAATPTMDTALRAEAALVLGGADVPAEARPPAAGPPPYQPTPMPPAFEAADELAAALAAPMADIAIDQTEVERILAGVATLAERDRAGLAAALAPLAERYPCDIVSTWQASSLPGALRCLVEAVLGVEHDHTRIGPRSPHSRPRSYRRPCCGLANSPTHCGRTAASRCCWPRRPPPTGASTPRSCSAGSRRTRTQAPNPCPTT